MDSSLLDQNTVSIIRSPNKQFYFMAALDSNDLEHFSVTRGEFKVHDNTLGYHPTDNMVNGWHRHANEQVSIDDVTGMKTYKKLNEKKPNKGINCLCDATSSEFLPINMQKRFDISNSYSANLTIAQKDSFPGPPATTSSTAAAVLQVDHIEHNRIIASCLEGMSPSETHSKNDVVNAVSLAKLCDPSDVHQGLESGCYNPPPPPPSSGHGCYNPPPSSSGRGCYNPPPSSSGRGCYNPPPSSGHGCYNPPPSSGHGCYNPPPSSGHGCYNPPPSSGHGCYNPPPSSGQGKVKQSLRKSVKKTKSLHNNCNNSRKNCGKRLSSDADMLSNQSNVRMKSETRIENVLSSAFSVQPCSSISSSIVSSSSSSIIISSSSSSGQLSSRRRLSDRVRSAGESSRSENSDGNGDCEKCGNDEDALTSGFTSSGHESTTAIDETWDGYQLEPVTLQERRASFDRGHERRPSVDRCRSPIPSQPSSATSKPPAVNNNNITDSPKFPRSKRIQSLTGQEGPPSVGSGAASGGQGSYATSAELDAVKQELMQFVRTEVTKAKQEIIDAVRLLLLRQQ